MGFGTLFFGYFLLLDIAYYLITDVIAASIMALALSKLSGINRGFKVALYASLVFLVFSVLEFGYGAYEMLFTPPDNPTLITCAAIARNFILCILTLTMLEGMREVAAEVGLKLLSRKCKVSAYASLPVYVIAIVADTPSLFSHASPYFAAVFAVISMLITLAFIVTNLTSIYSCYSGICMPEEKETAKSSSKQTEKKESFREAYKRQREEREEMAKLRSTSKQTPDKKGNNQNEN